MVDVHADFWHGTEADLRSTEIAGDGGSKLTINAWLGDFGLDFHEDELFLFNFDFYGPASDERDQVV